MTLGFWHLYLLSKFNYSYSVTRLNNLEHVETISLLCMHIIHRYFQITVSFPAGCYETVTCRQKVKGWTSRCSCCLVCPLSPVLCDLGSCLLETQPGTENPFWPIKWGDPQVQSANSSRGLSINTLVYHLVELGDPYIWWIGSDPGICYFFLFS